PVTRKAGSPIGEPSFLGREASGLVFGGKGVDELIEVPLHHPVYLVERQIDPVVRYPALREIVGPNPLTAVAGADLRLAVRRAGGVKGGALLLIHAGAQDFHR